MQHFIQILPMSHTWHGIFLQIIDICTNIKLFLHYFRKASMLIIKEKKIKLYKLFCESAVVSQDIVCEFILPFQLLKKILVFSFASAYL